MINIISITPVYDADGTLMYSNVYVEVVLTSGGKGNANFTLLPEEIDLVAVSKSIKEKIKNGL